MAQVLKLSNEQAGWLRVVFESNGLYRRHVVTDEQKKANKHLTEQLVNLGLLNERQVTDRLGERVTIWAFTNRGLCHLVLDSKVNLQDVFKMFPEPTRAIQKEIELYKLQKLTQEEAELVWAEKARVSLENDFFMENNDFPDAQKIPQAQLAKMILQVYLASARNEKISVENLKHILGLPAQVSQSIGSDRQRLIEMISMQLEMYR